MDAPSEWAVPEIELAIENGLVTEKVLSNYQDDITRKTFANWWLSCMRHYPV